MRYWFFRSFLLIVISGVLSAGCDTMPGNESGIQNTPEVHPGEVFVSPEIIDTDRLDFVNGKATTEISVSVTLTDEDLDVSKVFVVVQSPVNGANPAGEVEILVSRSGPRTIAVPLELSEGASGVYQVVVFAADSGERISNRIFGSVLVIAGSEPPVITQIDIPTSVTRPGPGQPPISVSIVAHVTDPDGLDNIARVEVLVNGFSTLRLCDDGGQGTCNSGFGVSGDAVAGDGLFTLTIQLDSNNAAGNNFFEFTAIDRSGLRSPGVSRTITLN
jgi:hypothetical protein